MRQGYPPITAAGVKAILKSLRTRVGLQSDRITSTSLALDALERLPSVRYRQSQGLDRATAIVEAVREAAGALPATESLIVDAALSLQMNAEAATGADLYAADLSDRRLRCCGNGTCCTSHGARRRRPRPPRAACALSGRTPHSDCSPACWSARNWRKAPGHRPAEPRGLGR